jgi:hypothetical protein
MGDWKVWLAVTLGVGLIALDILSAYAERRRRRPDAAAKDAAYDKAAE